MLALCLSVYVAHRQNSCYCSNQTAYKRTQAILHTLFSMNFQWKLKRRHEREREGEERRDRMRVRKKLSKLNQYLKLHAKYVHVLEISYVHFYVFLTLSLARSLSLSLAYFPLVLSLYLNAQCQDYYSVHKCRFVFIGRMNTLFSDRHQLDKHETSFIAAIINSTDSFGLSTHSFVRSFIHRNVLILTSFFVIYLSLLRAFCVSFD